jgi:flagellar hook-length control protein FliK
VPLLAASTDPAATPAVAAPSDPTATTAGAAAPAATAAPSATLPDSAAPAGPAASGATGGASTGAEPGTQDGGQPRDGAGTPAAVTDDSPAEPSGPAGAAPAGAPPAEQPVPGSTHLPTAELRRTDAPSTVPATAPAAPPTPAAPSAQLVQHLGPLLEGPDGSYALSLQLYPEELGAVRVDVALRAGEISLALHAGDDRAQEALRAALPDLRAALEDAGLTATAMSVDGGQSEQSPQDERLAHQPRRTGSGPAGAPDTTPVLQSSDPDAALDLRM